MEKPVIIFGFNAIGKAALEIFRSHGVIVYGFLDDKKELFGDSYDEIPILGSTDDPDFIKLIDKKCGAFIASDENKVKKSLVKSLNEGKEMPVNAIHNRAFVSESAHIGNGNFINAGAVLGSKCKVPNHCLIHANAIIEVEAELGDFTQIGAGSIINSGVKVGPEVFIGSGVTIVSGIKIEEKANIGAGSVVVKDVKKGEAVFGNPAESLDI